MTTPPPALERCAQLYQLGTRVALGRTDDDDYALWNVSGGLPFATFADGVAGWTQAVDHYNGWERPPAPARASHAGRWTLIVILAIGAAIYYAIHEHRYDGCLITPGLFEWPSACI